MCGQRCVSNTLCLLSCPLVNISLKMSYVSELFKPNNTCRVFIEVTTKLISRQGSCNYPAAGHLRRENQSEIITGVDAGFGTQPFCPLPASTRNQGTCTGSPRLLAALTSRHGLRRLAQQATSPAASGTAATGVGLSKGTTQFVGSLNLDVLVVPHVGNVKVVPPPSNLPPWRNTNSNVFQPSSPASHVAGYPVAKSPSKLQFAAEQ